MHKKKGFSMLELIIVIAIVGILFVTFRGYFQVKNKDILYGQSCIETIYGQVNNFVHAGLSSKSVSSGILQIFPEYYSIVFDTTNQVILLKYKTAGEDASIYETIDISGGVDTNYCRSKEYTIVLSGENYELIINKGLKENQNLQFFFISGSIAKSTGENTFWQCDKQQIVCQKTAIFQTDTRIMSIKKQMCLSLSTTGDCLEWDN